MKQCCCLFIQHGWETWIRTKVARSRAESSTAKLFPNALLLCNDWTASVKIYFGPQGQFLLIFIPCSAYCMAPWQNGIAITIPRAPDMLDKADHIMPGKALSSH